ncbi:hypothetical protein M9H77_31724 [Catharanthus roseus]|uniref:Uncharacterized protein n=1 Tax=Catharanthus roseus TaxID=4058 RepID=A0ACC0A0X0_CATRO|nr:hypothetical protein M9H77_31724 [Catharanthus roseus]
MSDTNIYEFSESNKVSFVLGIEDQRKSGGKGVLLSPTNSSISFLINSSPSYLAFYFNELKLFLNAYAFYEIIVESLCATFRTCDLCLIDVHLSNCLSFQDSLSNQLLIRDAKLEQYFFDLKRWHDILDIISLGMIPYFLDLFVGNFLVKKVEGYLCSLIGDLFNKSIWRNVVRCSYMISSFETFVIPLKRISPFKNHLWNVEVQFEDPCDDHKFLIGLEVLKAFLIENILSFQLYHLHFQEGKHFYTPPPTVGSILASRVGFWLQRSLRKRSTADRRSGTTADARNKGHLGNNLISSKMEELVQKILES